MLTVTNLPQALPVAEAARRAGLTEDELQKMIQSGRIVAFATQDGEVLIPVDAQGKLLMLAPPAEAERPQPQSQQSQNGNGHLDDDLNARLARIRREDFAHMRGELITISEASVEFEVPGRTIRDWLKRGYIQSFGKYPTRLDKAEVAFCAAIYKVRKEYNSRAPLLDKQGRPYLLKEPELARLRRLAKTRTTH